MKFRKKPVVIEATRWFSNGDHSKDECRPMRVLGMVLDGDITEKIALTEGKIVRRFSKPDVTYDSSCKYCGNIMHLHGWIDTLEGGHIVCPGDWIIEGIKGEFYPCKPDIFEKTYEPIDNKETKNV